MFNKGRVTQCDSQSFTLAYGVINYALVSAQNVAVAIDEITFLNVGSVRILTDIVSVVSVRNKTDILRFRLLTQLDEPSVSCHLPNLRLGELTQREQGAFEVVFRQRP